MDYLAGKAEKVGANVALMNLLGLAKYSSGNECGLPRVFSLQQLPSGSAYVRVYSSPGGMLMPMLYVLLLSRG